MWARVVETRAPEALREGDRAKEMIEGRVIPALREIGGFQRGVWLGERESGTGLGVVFYGSKEELDASRDATAETRERAAQEAGIEFVSMREFEVITQV